MPADLIYFQRLQTNLQKTIDTTHSSRGLGHGLNKLFVFVYTNALLATIVLALENSQPVSYADAQT